MTRPVNDFYEFGEFRLDPIRRVLLRGSETVAVTPKAFDTLLVLIEGRDRVMEKDELMRRVWPDAIVEEVGLAKNISALRKALGERLGEHRYIVTVPGRGYRFVADVTMTQHRAAESVESTPSPAAAVVETPPRSPRPLPARGLVARYPALLAAFGLVIAALMASAYFADARRPAAAPLTPRDTILLAGFVNRTDDPIFDEVLRQGLAAQLEQSPFLNLFPEDQRRSSLRLLGHSPEAPMTKEIATELIRREGLKAFVSGTIAPVGQHYAVTLEATDHNGHSIAREQVEAQGKEDVLRALFASASRMRERLGESIGSVSSFSADVTTTSLDALKAFAEGNRLVGQGRWREAIPSYRRAVELDPNFASAYNSLGVSYSNTRELALAAEAMRKAYALRDRVSSYERARIVHFYLLNVTGDFTKAIDELERHRRTYPRDNRSYVGLGLAYLRLGQYEKAAEATRTSIRLNPRTPVAYVNLAQALMRLGRFDESNQVITQAIEELKIGADGLRRFRYLLAYTRGDAETMRREIDALTGTPAEHMAFSLQSNAAIFEGRWLRAQMLARRGVDAAVTNGANGPAGEIAADVPLWGAVLGQCSLGGSWATESQALDASEATQPRVALALALCGEPTRATATMNDASARYPENTVVQAIWLPIVRAALEQQRGADAAAIELLKPVTHYQAAAQFWPQYLRGQSYLRLRKGPEAAAEFRSILTARGQAVASPLYPLAHLGLARAATMTGDAALARKAYDDFFALWKDADPDLLPLTQARADAGTLK